MTRLRLLTAGESHGKKLAGIVEGLPAGLTVDPEFINRDLARRQQGYGRGFRMRSIERDTVDLLAGVRFGQTLGGPVLIEVQNADNKNWDGVMDALPVSDQSRAEEKALFRPRPGHADLTGAQKYDRTDLRDILERASARNTAVRVAAGAVAKALIAQIGVRVFSFVETIGGVDADIDWAALENAEAAAEASDVRCPDPSASEKMKARIDAAKKAGDTVGGRFCVVALGTPPGLGSHVEWDRRLDGRIAQSVMSIQAVKAVELGIGTENANVLGSDAHDAIELDTNGRYARVTNRAGGFEGGMSTGEPLIVRGTMKPISTLAKPLASVDMRTKQVVEAGYERSDVCAVPACGVIAEAAVAFCLADAALEKFGGDAVADFEAAHRAYMERLSS